ncbi:unnamed protein product [Amaranthus hypochondriacus]
MNYPRNVEDVINDFKARRLGIIKALTKDFEEFYQLCDPNQPNLCLYGFPDQQWEVNLPPPSDLPEPRLGINFVRDTMSKQDWLAMVALHSDAWLYSLASYFCTKFNFDKADKKRLFSKLSDFNSITKIIDGSSRKRGKLEDGGLPHEILFDEILVRLPVRDLLKYRCVCKTWKSLIDGQEFVYAHLKNYKNNYEGNHLLVISGPKNMWYMTRDQVMVRRGDTFRKVMELEFLVASDGTCNLSYVNGLILVKKKNYRGFNGINLWNPSINRYLNVPNPNSMFDSLNDATYFELGLGFYSNSCLNDYKIIIIVYPSAEVKYNFGRRYRATISGLVHVYTLSSNSWCSILGISPPYWSVGKQVFFNGAIHWINFGPNIVAHDSWYKEKDSYLASFEVENEVFKYFELPTGMKDGDEPKIKFPTILGGSLAIFCAYSDHQNDIWVMKEYGVSDSWSKCYSFKLVLDDLLHFNNNGELFFVVNRKGIKSYDVKTDKVRDLAKTYSRSCTYTVFTYVESLVFFNK